ncbi:hypothetical protein TWF102_009588 [Orbilia oligospora]|uniref:Uncharacterized protein n=1 Tax=Orbilia oligospora TaxID=2813651 RepID=A0A7C8JAS6_ORBOL|nr:hypothetical protein TWF102_009588 [Orbilia oligospora]KAF3093755.1 hypothetical protein TWF706_008660 [Orbilia oligospora]KAF3100024.1 hypothetical protein TWF103_008531 [Orbilia oligospora]KAF3138081.1 hypothetical protein TWF594_007334 [Orbilia oligospora]
MGLRLPPSEFHDFLLPFLVLRLGNAVEASEAARWMLCMHVCNGHGHSHPLNGTVPDNSLGLDGRSLHPIQTSYRREKKQNNNNVTDGGFELSSIAAMHA